MTMTAETDEAVWAVVQTFNAANSRRDSDGVLALFAPDADLVVIGSEAGETARGRDEFRAMLGRVFARGEGIAWSWTWHTVSVVRTVAWVVAEGRVHAQDAAPETGTPYRLTAIFEQREGRWLWRHYHGSEPV